MKRILLIALLALGVLLSIASASHAQEGPSINTYYEGTTAHDQEGDMNNPALTRESQNNVGSFWSCGIMALPGECPGPESDETGFINSPVFQASLMGKVSGSIADLYTIRPAGTDMYLADVGSRIGIVQPAYAQGIGFQGLSPLMSLWRVFRNISYGFLIIMMVLIGFMIMFRMKIDPRTVISIQAALPRIIMTVILITFSYAIVGILIDIMYLVMFLMITALNTAVPFQNFSETVANYTGGSLSAIFSAMNTAGSGSIQAVVNLLGGTTLNVIGGVIGAVVGGLTGGPAALFTAAAGGIAGAASPHILVGLIIKIAILFAFLRILFLILNAYIQIILSLILGPLQLMLGAIPNNNAFSSWIRNLIANLAVFPTISGLLLMGQLLTSSAFRNPNTWTPPGLGGGPASAVSGLIGLGMALMIPNVANSIKEALKAKPPIPAGLGALTQPVGVATGGAQQLLGLYHQFQSMAYYRAMIGRSGPGSGGGGTHP